MYVLVFQTKVGNTKQSAQLLDFLLRGDSDTMDKLIYALRKSGHDDSTVKECLRDPIKPDSVSDLARAGEYTNFCLQY